MSNEILEREFAPKAKVHVNGFGGETDRLEDIKGKNGVILYGRDEYYAIAVDGLGTYVVHISDMHVTENAPATKFKVGEAVKVVSLPTDKDPVGAITNGELIGKVFTIKEVGDYNDQKYYRLQDEKKTYIGAFMENNIEKV